MNNQDLASIKLTYTQRRIFNNLAANNPANVTIGDKPGNLARAIARALERKGLVTLHRRPHWRVTPNTKVVLTDLGRAFYEFLATQPKQEAKPWELPHNELRAMTKQILGVYRDARTDGSTHPRDLAFIRAEALLFVSERVRRHWNMHWLVAIIQRTHISPYMTPTEIKRALAIHEAALADIKKRQPRQTCPRKETATAMADFARILKKLFRRKP